MAAQDKCCRIIAHLKVQSGKLEAFTSLCEQSVEKTSKEPKCEGYENADALLYHVENANSLLEEFWKISQLTRLEIHGPEEELAKLREPLAAYKPQFFTLMFGFRG